MSITDTQKMIAEWRRGNFEPPHSSRFASSSECEFYRWSWQTFLWLTQPTRHGMRFESDPFWDFDAATGQFTSHMKFGIRDVKREEVGEVGQAGGNNVLLDQKGSLVHYAQHVNPVFRWFSEARKSNAIQADRYPTTNRELAAVAKYIQSKHGLSPKGMDFETFAIEMKSSWIEVEKGSAQAARFLTIHGEVPEFRKGAKGWMHDPRKMRKVTLALVGLHVVGTVNKHPEFIWATFEHVDNAPDANYFYEDKSGGIKEVRNFDGSGKYIGKKKNWLFYNTTTNLKDANKGKGAWNGKAIVPAPAATSVVRKSPWGNPSGAKDKNTIRNNTAIISLNQFIHTSLSPKDLRKNYLLIGAVWTDGSLPVKKPHLGSKELANATMETFMQYKGMNCFSCHAGNGLDISHLWSRYNSSK